MSERPPTIKMLQWLNLLWVQPGSERHSRVGFLCMQRGWTEWNWVDDLGEPITLEKATELYGVDGRWERVRSSGERLTDAGRAILARYTL